MMRKRNTAPPPLHTPNPQGFSSWDDARPTEPQQGGRSRFSVLKPSTHARTTPAPSLCAPVSLHAGELDLLDESLVKLCLEHSQSLSEAVLSDNRAESASLGWSSPTHCFSSLKGILCHLSVG